MRLVVFSVVLLSASVFTAAPYEVIFHEGFEGDQFPPAGWTYGGTGSFERVQAGYESEWCGQMSTSMSEGMWVRSCEIPITGGELYDFRFFSATRVDRTGHHGASVFFDDDSYFPFGLSEIVPYPGYDWTSFAVQEYAPADAEYVYFRFWCSHPGMLEYMLWSIDNVSVIHTATTITPSSLGRVKVLYR